MSPAPQAPIGLDDEQLLSLASEAEDFIMKSFEERDLISLRNVGAHLQKHLPAASAPEVYFAAISAIASLRSRGLVIFGDNDVQQSVVSQRKQYVPHLASLFMDRGVRWQGSEVKEQQNPFHAHGRPIVPTARCMSLIGVRRSAAGPLTRWSHLDQLLDELASVYHLGSMLGAAGLARAIVEESIRLAANDLPTFALSKPGLAGQMSELFSEIASHPSRRSIKFDTFDRSSAVATLELARSMGNAALHSATSPSAVDLQVLVLSTLPRAIGWLSAASDPNL